MQVFDANWMQIEDYLARDDRDLLDTLAAQGFRRIAIVNGHGGNAPVTGFLREWLCQPRAGRVQVLFHSWYNAPRTAAAAARFDPEQLHGGGLDPAGVRAAAPDGVLGGAYARPDEDMRAVWDAGVAEVRSLLETGWAQ